ncbi:MAG: hypothetical protein WAT19_10760 [Ferruginibacter sp.]
MLKESIYLLIQLATSFSFLSSGDDLGENKGFNMVFILYAVLTVALLFLVYLFIFRPAHIINLFKLDKGFEEEKFNFSINVKHAILFGVVIIAALLLIDEIPNIFQWLYIRFYAERTSFLPTDNASYGPLIISAAKIITGLLLIGERKRIAAYLADTDDEENTEDADTETSA